MCVCVCVGLRIGKEKKGIENRGGGAKVGERTLRVGSRPLT